MAYKSSEINTFQKLVEACGWTEIDGSLPGVFDYMGPGNRCVWASKWICVDGIISPENTGPGEAYPDLLEAELLDYYYQGDPNANDWITLLRKEPGETSTHGAYVHCLQNRRLMAEAREPFYWPFGPLNKAVVIRLQRPGSWCADTISYQRKLRMEEAAKVAMS